jgi:hypothetical protein
MGECRGDVTDERDLRAGEWRPALLPEESDEAPGRLAELEHRAQFVVVALRSEELAVARAPDGSVISGLAQRPCRHRLAL